MTRAGPRASRTAPRLLRLGGLLLLAGGSGCAARGAAGSTAGALAAAAAAAEPVATLEVALAPGVTMTERRFLYRLEGTSVAELRRAVARIGPLDGATRHAAYTRTNLRWSYPFAREPEGCRTGPVAVDLEVTYILPVHATTPTGAAAAGTGAARAPKAIPAAVQREWRRYVGAVERHERGHGEVGIRAARELAQALGQLDRHATCEEVDRAGNQEGQAAVERIRVGHQELDRRTEHGKDVGARLRTETEASP